MIIAVTGHRPEKIKVPTADLDKLFQATFLEAEPELVIVGMAAGIDLIAGIAAIKTSFPVLAAVPFRGHKPRKADEADYSFVNHFAQQVYYCNEAKTYPGPWVYQKRNEFMVDNATHLLAYWDGTEGGTKNCVDYALKQDMKVRNLYGRTV